MPSGRMGIHALASFDTSTGAMVVNGADGCALTYSGVGDALITLDRPLDLDDMCILGCIRGATIGSFLFNNNTDAAKQILIRNETPGGLAAAERAIDIAILKVSAIDRKFIHAAGYFGGSAAGAAVAISQRGGVVIRTAVGVYQLTLDRGIDQRECSVQVSVGPGAGAAMDLHARVEHTSDTVKTITVETLAAGADVDADISWAVFSMLNAPDQRVYGVGSIDAAGGNPVGRGCLPVRNGAGDYQYTMDRASVPFVGLATPIGATGMAIRIAQGAVARKDVETQVQAGPGTQTNCDHSAVFLRIQ